MIRIDQVSRAFAGRTVLDRVSWTARPGRVTCLLGPNGAGKTTTVEIAEGLQYADSGTVQVLGADPWRAGAEHRARVGVMLQDGGLPQAVRPLTLLHHLARFYAAPADVAQLSEQLGLDHVARTSIRRLSGGERQKVALAAALIGQPEALFLDEPTAGLDPSARRTVWDLVRATADGGATVVVTTHSFEEAARIGDHLVIMGRGRVLADGTSDQLAPDGDLESAYFALTDTLEAP